MAQYNIKKFEKLPVDIISVIDNIILDEYKKEEERIKYYGSLESIKEQIYINLDKLWEEWKHEDKYKNKDEEALSLFIINADYPEDIYYKNLDDCVKYINEKKNLLIKEDFFFSYLCQDHKNYQEFYEEYKNYPILKDIKDDLLTTVTYLVGLTEWKVNKDLRFKKFCEFIYMKINEDKTTDITNILKDTWICFSEEEKECYK